MSDKFQFKHKVFHDFMGSQCCQTIKELGIDRVPASRLNIDKNDMNVFGLCIKDVTAEGAAFIGKITKIFKLVRVIFRNIKTQIRHDVMASLYQGSATEVSEVRRDTLQIPL